MATTLIQNTRKEIIQKSDPKGRFWEGIVYGTPKPGMIMGIRAAAGISSDLKLTFEVATPGGDGQRVPIFVLLPDWLIGQDIATAYVSGARCFVYAPLPGDDLLVMFDDTAGTGDDIAVGDMMILQNASGKIIKTASTPEAEPFQALESLTDPTADQLMHVLFTGY